MTHRNPAKAVTHAQNFVHICTYIYIFYYIIYTCRDNISKCSEVDLRGGGTI